MGDVVNLNKYRKQKARREHAKKAEQNRLKSGLSPQERALRARKKALDDRKLDGHKLDKGHLRPVDEQEEMP